MGKSGTRPRGKSNRPKPFNPVGLNTLTDAEKLEDPLLKQLALAAAGGQPSDKNKVALLVKKLSATDAGDRAWAASAISILSCNDPTTRNILLASNVIGSLIALLNDPNREVIVEALGTLRNLSSSGDAGIVTEMFNKKIMIPLHKLMETCSDILSKVVQGVTPTNEAEKEDRRVCFQVAENIICIFWIMAETSTKLLTQVSQDLEMNFIISFLHSAPLLPETLVVTAARCLLTLTENNFELFDGFFMEKPENLRTIESLLQGEKCPMLRVLAVGVLTNLHSLIGPKIERKVAACGLESLLLFSSSFYTTLLSHATAGLLSSADIGSRVDRALVEVPKQQDEQEAVTREGLKNLDSKSSALIEVESLLSDQHVVLEILAGLTSEDQIEEQEEDEPNEEAMDDDEEEEGDSDLEIPNDIEFDNAEVEEESPSVPFTLDILLPKLRELAGPHPLTTSQIVQPHHESIVTGLIGLHYRALGVLNNVLSRMATMAPSSREKLVEKYQNGVRDLWNFLFGQVSTYSQMPSEDHQEVVSQALSSLWALARWAGHQALDLTDEHLNFLLNLAKVSSGAASVKAVGILGFIAKRRPGHTGTNKLVGDYLIQIVGQSPDSDLVFGALNAIYDIYDDASYDYDAVFVSNAYLNVLETALPRVIKMVRCIDRRKDFDLREHGDLTLINLRAFIKYKKQERDAASKK